MIFLNCIDKNANSTSVHVISTKPANQTRRCRFVGGGQSIDIQPHFTFSTPEYTRYLVSIGCLCDHQYLIESRISFLAATEQHRPIVGKPATENSRHYHTGSKL